MSTNESDLYSEELFLCIVTVSVDCCGINLSINCMLSNICCYKFLYCLQRMFITITVVLFVCRTKLDEALSEWLNNFEIRLKQEAGPRTELCSKQSQLDVFKVIMIVCCMSYSFVWLPNCCTFIYILFCLLILDATVTTVCLCYLAPKIYNIFGN